MNDYLNRVKEQLCCNASKEYSENFITYEYTNEQIKNNIHFFEKCKKNGTSPYKALLFFSYYLDGDYDVNNDEN